MYDDKHRFQVLSSVKDEADWYEQKGLRQYLLCDVCEDKISKWEDYACKVLKGGVETAYAQTDNTVHISGLDYSQFKLFQLSILWRASVSSLNFFKQVNLGVHQEAIRKLLSCEDPANPFNYPCMMYGLKTPTGILDDLIMQPDKLRIEGRTVYRFVFGGFLWAFHVSSHPLPRSFEEFILGKSGTVTLHLQSPYELGPLGAFARTRRTQGRT